MTARVNLAPEVYQQSQRNKRRRKIAATVAITASVISGGLVILMLVLLGAQKATIAVQTNDIKNKQKQIEQNADLVKAVTAQKNLAAWGQVADSSSQPSKFFEVLQQFVPQGISINSITLDSSNQLELNGTAKTYGLITKFTKALEAANVDIGKNSSPQSAPYFTNTELVSAQSSSEGVDFKLTTTVSKEVNSGK